MKYHELFYSNNELSQLPQALYVFFLLIQGLRLFFFLSILFFLFLKIIIIIPRSHFVLSTVRKHLENQIARYTSGITLGVPHNQIEIYPSSKAISMVTMPGHQGIALLALDCFSKT